MGKEKRFIRPPNPDSYRDPKGDFWNMKVLTDVLIAIRVDSNKFVTSIKNEMKEYIVRIPEEYEQVITSVMEKFGVETTELKKRKKLPLKISSAKKKNSSKVKIDHTYLFNKWKDFDIDAKKLREQSW